MKPGGGQPLFPGLPSFLTWFEEWFVGSCSPSRAQAQISWGSWHIRHMTRSSSLLISLAILKDIVGWVQGSGVSPFYTVQTCSNMVPYQVCWASSYFINKWIKLIRQDASLQWSRAVNVINAPLRDVTIGCPGRWQECVTVYGYSLAYCI